MVAAPKKNLGKMPCPDCRQPVAVMQALSGTLSYKCQEAECEATGFAASHTAAAKKWLAALGSVPKASGAPAAPAPPPSPGKTPPSPVPKAPAKQAPPAPDPQPPKKGGFSLSGL